MAISAPCGLNVRDIRPVASHRYHLPPSVHTTFLADRFVVCTFTPRPFETDPGALKVPFFHNNDDFDEVLFYHAGDFFSRDNIDAGMMTFHPSGFTHGPHPKALKSMLVQKQGRDRRIRRDDRRPRPRWTSATEPPASRSWPMSTAGKAECERETRISSLPRSGEGGTLAYRREPGGGKARRLESWRSAGSR